MVTKKNDSVILNFDSASILIIWRMLEEVSRYIKQDLVVTSGNDGKHSSKSLHKKDRAMDVRTWSLKREVLKTIISMSHEILGKDYDVVFEATIKNKDGSIKRGEHLHIEYDPK